MMEIPKIIHQTWKNEKLFWKHQEWSNTWKTMFPDWKYILWTDKDNRDFVKEHYPQYLEKYDNLPTNIQRADVIRYMILKKMGGLYVDLDFEVRKPEFINLLENDKFIIGREPASHEIAAGITPLICNALVASIPNHPFLSEILDKIWDNPKLNDFDDEDYIVNSTGPHFISNVYRNFPKKDTIKVIDAKHLYPLDIRGARNAIHGEFTKDNKERFDNAEAVHYYVGTWR